jgi:hypothetical protein
MPAEELRVPLARYCEERQWPMPLCPGKNGHQGVDIRPQTPDNATWPVLAADDGVDDRQGNVRPRDRFGIPNNRWRVACHSSAEARTSEPPPDGSIKIAVGRFSNRPSGSSPFRLSTTPVSMSLTGSCFSSDSAPRPFHHGDSKMRWNNLSGGLAVSMTVGPSGHANSPHPSSREGHHSTARWSYRAALPSDER